MLSHAVHYNLIHWKQLHSLFIAIKEVLDTSKRVQLFSPFKQSKPKGFLQIQKHTFTGLAIRLQALQLQIHHFTTTHCYSKQTDQADRLKHQGSTGEKIKIYKKTSLHLQSLLELEQGLEPTGSEQKQCRSPD